MTQRRPGQQEQPNGLRNSFDWLVTLAWSVSTPVETVLHKDIGHRYLGLNALGGLVLLVLFAGLGGGPTGSGTCPMVTFIAIYLLACARARMAAARRGKHGDYVHSYSCGESVLCRLAPKMEPENVKRFLEPFLVFVAGFLLSGPAEALGHYLLAASIGLIVGQQVRAHADATRIANMRDAEVDARRVMEYLRRSQSGTNH